MGSMTCSHHGCFLAEVRVRTERQVLGRRYTKRIHACASVSASKMGVRDSVRV